MLLGSVLWREASLSVGLVLSPPLRHAQCWIWGWGFSQRGAESCDLMRGISKHRGACGLGEHVPYCVHLPEGSGGSDPVL